MVIIFNSSRSELLSQFVIENQDKFYRLAFSYAKNRETALDMVQEAIISAYESIHKVKNTDYLKTWFYRILVNKCLAEHKRGQRSITSSEIIGQTASYDEYHPEIIDLYNAIDRLEPQFKTVVILRYFEDMKIAEIAEILRSNESTIKSRISAACKKIEVLVRSEA